MKITILTDKSSWMNKYNVTFINKLEHMGHHVCLIHLSSQLEKGDIAFFLSCFEIIKKEKLQLNKHNIVIHESNLPQGKGWSPTTWQILEGENIIPLALFEANEKVDAGDIYIKDICTLDGTELIDEWQEKIANKTISMCLTFVTRCMQNNVRGEAQKGEESFYKKRRPSDSELDINKTIAEQFNLLRVVNNDVYPAFFKMNGAIYKLKIERVR